MDLRPARVATRGCSRPRAAPTCARRSWAACRRCRCTWASCRRRSLGAAVEAWDPDGQAGGRRGRRAGDHRADAVDADLLLGRRVEGTRYRESYFDVYPGVWRHGDWIKITSRGTAVIYGRSDSTINRGGVRMGTSGDLPRGARRCDEVVDALVVDVPARRRTRLDAAVRGAARGRRARRRRWSRQIRRRVREDCSPRHVPDEIRQIAEVPRTLSGKAARDPGQADPDGHAGRTGREPRVAGEPRALDYFVGLAAT